MLPNRADLEGIMVAGQHVNWPLEPPQDVADLLYYRSINTVVLERVSSDQDELGAVVPSNFDDSSRRLDARLTHLRAHGSGMGAFIPTCQSEVCRNFIAPFSAVQRPVAPTSCGRLLGEGELA